MTTDTIQISVHTVVSASRALLRAARFDEAVALLDEATSAADHRGLALAKVEVALAADYRRAAVTPAAVVEAAATAVEPSGDAGAAWDLGLLSVRRDFARQLFDPEARITSPYGRDDTEIADLRSRAQNLRDQAPDAARRGWAQFYLGVIADNVFGERHAAPPHYVAALEAAERHGDDLLAFEALRHLGDHDHDDGDAVQARQRWERSAAHAAKAGAVAQTLAQQLLLAVVARDRGDEAGATLLAGEVGRWAGAIGADRIKEQAEAFVAGADPTRAPDERSTTADD